MNTHRPVVALLEMLSQKEGDEQSWCPMLFVCADFRAISPPPPFVLNATSDLLALHLAMHVVHRFTLEISQDRKGLSVVATDDQPSRVLCKP